MQKVSRWSGSRKRDSHVGKDVKSARWLGDRLRPCHDHILAIIMAIDFRLLIVYILAYFDN